MKSVTGVVYLTAPVFIETSKALAVALNGTREFVYASFDFSPDMVPAFDVGILHYSVSSLLYLQTLIPILLLYIQVRPYQNTHPDNSRLTAHDKTDDLLLFFRSQYIDLYSSTLVRW
jgi:hypothetical protein